MLSRSYVHVYIYLVVTLNITLLGKINVWLFYKSGYICRDYIVVYIS